MGQYLDKLKRFKPSQALTTLLPQGHNAIEPAAKGGPAIKPGSTRCLEEEVSFCEHCGGTLVHLRDHGESEQVRLAAATAILDRGHGRPRQELNLTDNTVTIVLNKPGGPPVVVGGQQNAIMLIEHQLDETQGASIRELNEDEGVIGKELRIHNRSCPLTLHP